MTGETATIHRSTVHYSGHVQGVGFRYTVLQVARGYEVSGYVENLPDGRVLLIAEGERAEVDGLVAGIEERMSGYIRKTERTDETGPRRHFGFLIK